VISFFNEKEENFKKIGGLARNYPAEWLKNFSAMLERFDGEEVLDQDILDTMIEERGNFETLCNKIPEYYINHFFGSLAELLKQHREEETFEKQDFFKAVTRHKKPEYFVNALSTFNYCFKNSDVCLTKDIFNVIKGHQIPTTFTEMLTIFKDTIKLLKENDILTPKNIETIGNLYKKVDDKYHYKLRDYIDIRSNSKYKKSVEKIGEAFYELNSTYIIKVPITQEIFDQIINHENPVKFAKNLIDPKPVVPKDTRKKYFKPSFKKTTSLIHSSARQPS